MQIPTGNISICYEDNNTINKIKMWTEEMCCGPFRMYVAHILQRLGSESLFFSAVYAEITLYVCVYFSVYLFPHNLCDYCGIDIHSGACGHTAAASWDGVNKDKLKQWSVHHSSAQSVRIFIHTAKTNMWVSTSEKDLLFYFGRTGGDYSFKVTEQQRGNAVLKIPMKCIIAISDDPITKLNSKIDSSH